MFGGHKLSAGDSLPNEKAHITINPGEESQ